MLEKELTAVRQAARQAGRAIQRVAQEHYTTAAKQADRTVVTQADLEADRILREALQKRFPEYGWLSEETRDDAGRFTCRRVWIVDPMDGTREFVMRTPEYVVSVALVEDGQPILGVIYNPLNGDLYEAVRGEGTKLNGQAITCDHVLDGKPVVEVSRSDIEKGRFTDFESGLDLRPCGSIAYKLARLASGQADSTLSVTPKNEWDIAAGVLLVVESGGRVTDLAGQAYVFNQKDTLVDGVIAASAQAYDKIKELTDAVRNGAG